MSTALLQAKTASNEAVKVSFAVQALIDALANGSAVTQDDLLTLRIDCGVLRCATALVVHAISKEPQHRRMEELDV